MSFSRLKLSAKYATYIGLFLLSFGVALFMFYDSGTKQEKLGIVLMTYGGLMIGMGYTAWVGLKTKF